LIFFFHLHWLLQLRQKIASATSAIKSVFGQEETRQDAVSLMSLGIGVAFYFDFDLQNIPMLLYNAG
jgi:hypothetical protein